jgi:hypothetical protein
VNASGDLDRIRVLHEQARKDRAASAVTGAPQGLVAPDSPGVAVPAPTMPRWPAYVCRDECQDAKAGQPHCSGTCRIAHPADGVPASDGKTLPGQPPMETPCPRP